MRNVGKMVTAIKITPIPPNHCNMARHINNPRDIVSNPDKTVAPVVVKPDIDSKKASTQDKFETDKLISNIKTPLYIGHGKNDPVIPYAQGLKLYDKAPHPKVFFSDDTADHHQLPKKGFIDAVLEDKE